MNTVPGVILESLLLKEMLGGLEVYAKFQDEGLESGRIQQKGHGRLSGFEFLVGDCEHGVSPFFILFHLKHRVIRNSPY